MSVVEYLYYLHTRDVSLEMTPTLECFTDLGLSSSVNAPRDF